MPAAGTYTTIQNVTITDATTGAAIYYTTDGSTPSAASTRYTAAIAVGVSETIKAIAVATGYSMSAPATAAYVINLPTLPAPAFSVAAGTYHAAIKVVLSDANKTATIYYTTDGSTPTTASTKYTAAITVSVSETIKALAVAPGFNPSSVATAAYVLVYPTAATPVITPAGNSYSSVLMVTMTDATAGAKIHHWINDDSETRVAVPREHEAKWLFP